MTTKRGNESIVQKENCFVEEIKEVELRSRREKFIYNRTYNPVTLNKVSHFSRRGRAPSRLPMKKLISFLKKTRKVRRSVFFIACCVFHVIVTQYMYDARCRDFALSASLC